MVHAVSVISVHKSQRLRSTLGFCAAALLVIQPSARTQTRGDVYISSQPENVVWGSFPSDRPPVKRVRAGQTVRIDTLSQRGASQNENPVSYLGALGVKPDEILKDVLDFWASRDGRKEGRGGHILTGPVYIESAEPGDTLEVQILELTPRVPYGINSTTPSAGVIQPAYASQPGDLTLELPASAQQHLIRTGRAAGRDVAFFSEDVQVPLAPFMGTMAVAPRRPAAGELGVTALGVQGSGPPGPYGGNLDFKMLTAGSSLFLPVFHPGALFYVGDPHGVQGDGEVSGNALEQSLTGVFRFVVHKGQTLPTPRVETATHYVLMGIDVDLNRAMRLAVTDVVRFLVAEKGMSQANALSLASIGVDFHVAEAVDGRQVIVGEIPKDLFLRR
jgi:acetamidase/formamidase